MGLNLIVFLVAAVVSFILPKPKLDEEDLKRDSGSKINKRSTTEYLPVIYGQRRAPGFINFIGVSGDKNEYLWMQQLICEGEIYDIFDVLIDNVSYTDSKYSGLITVSKYLGTDDQTADPDLVATFEDYTTNDRLQGIAYCVIKMKYHQDKLNRMPKIEFIIKGKKCYDTRSSVTAYTENPVVCLYDYLTNTRYGAGNKITASKLNTATFESAADDLDEVIQKYTGAIEYMTVGGMNAIIDTSKDVFENIKTMLASFYLHLVPNGDVYNLVLEQDGSSVFSLNEDNILQQYFTFALAESPDRYNTVKITFANEDKEYLDDQIIKQDATLLSADNNIESIIDERFDEDTVSYRLIHYANTLLKKSRQGIGAGVRAFESAFEILPGDIVDLTHPSPGWSAKKFRVVAVTEIIESQVIDITLAEHEGSVYNRFVPPSAPTPPDTYFPDPFTAQPPSGLMVNSGTNYLIASGDGTIITRIFVSWIAADDIFVEQYRIRYKKTSDSDYLYAAPAIGQAATSQFIVGVQDGVAYDIGVQSVNARGIASTWITTQHLVVGKTEAPPDIDEFYVFIQGDGTREANWTLNSPPADLAGYVLRYSTDLSDTWPDMQPLHKGMLTHSPWEFNTLPAGSYIFAIKAVDTTGNQSANALSAIIDLPDPRVGTVLKSESPRAQSWPGTLTDCVFDASTNSLVATSTTTWDELTNAWDDYDADWYFDTAQSFTYQYTEIDLGAVLTHTLLINTELGQNSSAVIEERHSDDGVSYSSWAVITGQIEARYQQIRVTVTNTETVGQLKNMTILIGADSIQDRFRLLDTSTLTVEAGGGFRVPVTYSFKLITDVNISLYSVGAGATWEFLDLDTANGPHIKIYNSSGSLIYPIISAQVIGV